MADGASRLHDGLRAAALALAAVLAATPAASEAKPVGAGDGEAFDPASAFGFGASTGTLDVRRMDLQVDTRRASRTVVYRG